MTDTEDPLPEPPDQWELGRQIEAARGAMSIRQAAKRAGVSEGRWRQVEKGYQTIRPGVYVTARPTFRTVIAMADAVGFDRLTAMRLADLRGREMSPGLKSVLGLESADFADRRRDDRYDVSDVPLDVLLEEIARRARSNNPGADA